jgi:hypothetical protein
MRKLLFFIIIILWGVQPFAQSLQGYYTGQLKVSGRSLRMGLQLDLVEQNGFYMAVLRSRLVEEGFVSGCDNWMEGKMNGRELVLKNIVMVKENSVPPGSCNQLGVLKIKINTGKPEPELTGNWLDINDELFGRFTLTRVDTMVSYSMVEEEAIARRNVAEKQMFFAPNDSIKIELMRSARGAEWLDTIEIKSKDANLHIAAPEADIFHKLTVLLNNEPVLIDSSPRQKGAVVRLKEMGEGYVEVLLLCYHAMVDVMYDVQIKLEWEGGSREITVPVSTYKNRGIVLRFVKAE